MKVKASRLDQEFDEGKDVSRYLEMPKARRPGLEQRRVNVEFPVRMINALDREATRLGVTRVAVVRCPSCAPLPATCVAPSETYRLG